MSFLGTLSAYFLEYLTQSPFKWDPSKQSLNFFCTEFLITFSYTYIGKVSLLGIFWGSTSIWSFVMGYSWSCSTDFHYFWWCCFIYLYLAICPVCGMTDYITVPDISWKFPHWLIRSPSLRPFSTPIYTVCYLLL